MYSACGGEQVRKRRNWGPLHTVPRTAFPRPRQEDCVPCTPCSKATHRLIKNLSSARDERSFRGTTLIVISTIQLSRTRLIGGPEGARTPDLIHAMDALSQLRYRPMLFVSNE